MWNKKVIVTKHAKERFEQRYITSLKKFNDPVSQILYDLKPLNVRKLQRLKNNNYKVTTAQGKVYIVFEGTNACFVKTVYQKCLRWSN